MFKIGMLAARVIQTVVMTLVVAAAFVFGDVGRARADGGVPIPAAAGTEWKIAGGYNTRTHSEYDGQDPHAIDIVRTDALTDWSAVLSPTDGTVQWFDDNCVMIVDARNFAHLLCHLQPDGRLQRGLAVSVGDQLGLVFPPWLDANGGLAHIHYAIHHHGGNGFLGRSIPFSGDYAIEGVELHWSDEFNLHSGRVFVSTNGPGWTAPADPPAEVEPAPGDDGSGPPVYEETDVPAAPIGGWRMVGVPRAVTVAEHFAALEGPILSFYLWHAGIQHFERYRPDAASAEYVGARVLPAGSAVIAEIDPERAWAAPVGGTPGRYVIALAPGRNLVSWQGSASSPAEALAEVPGLSHAFRWDPVTERYLVWAENTPLGSLERLEPGDAVWLVVEVPGVWIQG